jgi:hypothetical protein
MKLSEAGTRHANGCTAVRHRLPDHVVVRTLVLETVVLNLNTGQYHGLNTTAGRVLEMLGAGLTVEEVAERLAAQTRQPQSKVLDAVAKTCTALIARRLLEPDPAPHTGRAAAATQASAVKAATVASSAS